MYESPITMVSNYCDNIIKQVNDEGEHTIMASITERIGIDIDKQELIRALNYDRQQYNVGYADGKRAGVIEELEKITNEILNLEDEETDLDDDYEFGMYQGYKCCELLIGKHIAELKGE